MADANQPCTVQNAHHVGIAVKNLEESLRFFREVFGFKPGSIMEDPGRGLRASIIDIEGGFHLEVLESTRNDTAIAKHIQAKGEGLHHLCFRVADVAETRDTLKAKNLPLLNEEPIKGFTGHFVFLSPDAAHGIPVELSQAFQE